MMWMAAKRSGLNEGCMSQPEQFDFLILGSGQSGKWHCQLNGAWNGFGQIDRDRKGSSRSVDADLLSPDPECFGPSASVAGCRHQMAPRPKVAVDHAVRRKERLRLAG